MDRFSDLERNYVLKVLEDGFRTSRNSEFNNRLEKAFCELFGTRFAIGHVNGTATLHTALASAGVGPGDEVVVPPLTMSSTALAVLQNGSIPVFADVDERTFNLSADSLEKCIGPRTKAVISVALYGLPPDYDSLMAVCRKHRIALIEDNAESFLSRYKGKMIGTFGAFSSFSFQASKHLTAGEGGMLLTDDIDLANVARRFSSLGYAGVSATQGKITREDIQNPQYSRHVSLGFNYRMSELCAAAVLGQLERAETLVALRIRVAQMFDRVVCATKIATPQLVPSNCTHSYWTYAFYLHTQKPEADWYRFRRLFLRNGGDGFYAAWKLSYHEPLFQDQIQSLSGIEQDYKKVLCPRAEFLQPRMVQLKTNYWQEEEAIRQAEILGKTLEEFGRGEDAR
jgi:perosamine synthetase